MAELALAQLMERRLDARGVGGAYRERPVKQLSRAAAGLTAAGALLIARAALAARRPIAGGALLSAGALAERWTIFTAGLRRPPRARRTRSARSATA